MLRPEQLSLRLPFPRSQSLGYQFWCMTGAHESYLKELEMGEWQGFSCSLSGLKEVTPVVIVINMRESDAAMAQLLATIDLSQSLRNGKRAFEVVQRMIE